MNWKKIFKYTLIFLLASGLILAFLAQKDLKRIYGGLTERVDPEKFNVEPENIMITDIHILSRDGVDFISGQTVIIKNGIISKIDSIPPSDVDYKQIDGKGKYLMPGLIDSHVHLFKSRNDLLLYIANGITGIREMIGEEDHLEWRKEIKDGRLGPDMYIASPRLGSFKGIESWFMEWSQGFNTINSEEEAKNMVQEYSEMGYDAVKVYSHLNKEAYDAVNKYARDYDLDVVGHIPWSISLQELYTSNQKEIAHLEELLNVLRREFGSIEGEDSANRFLEYIHERSDSVSEQLIKNNIAVTTTLWLTKSFVRQKFELEKVLREVELEYANPGITEWNERIPQGLGWLPEVNRYKIPGSENLNPDELRNKKIFWTVYGEACGLLLENLSEAGVTIMAGTDANLPPTVPGFSLHDELQSMYEAGMTPAQVIQSATRIPAEWMGISSGQIKEGYKANLLLLDKNPLSDIRHTKSIHAVILGGRILDRHRLDDLLTAVKKSNDESRSVDITEFINSK